MIKINCPDSDRIANEYYKRFDFWMQYNGRGTTPDRLQKQINLWRANNNNKAAEMLEMFYNRRCDIICGDYPNLRNITAEFLRKFRVDIANNPAEFEKFKKKMISLYDNFMKDNGKDGEVNGVWLTQRLGIKTCPYCNRQYTFTVKQSKTHPGIRPQFDHFLPKSKYPLLALSFYNLIPACPECNRIKKDEVLDIYPHNDDFDSNGLKFRVGMRDKSNKIVVKALNTSDFEITITNGDKNKNVTRLGLTELYNEHKDYVAEIIRKCQAYSADYYTTLIQTYRGMNLSESDIHRMIWSAYIDDGEQGRRPLSKLTKDIMEQFNIKI